MVQGLMQEYARLWAERVVRHLNLVSSRSRRARWLSLSDVGCRGHGGKGPCWCDLASCEGSGRRTISVGFLHVTLPLCFWLCCCAVAGCFDFCCRVCASLGVVLKSGQRCKGPYVSHKPFSHTLGTVITAESVHYSRPKPPLLSYVCSDFGCVPLHLRLEIPHRSVPGSAHGRPGRSIQSASVAISQFQIIVLLLGLALSSA